MNYITIKNNSGGNHGHQLKDMFGGLTIAKLYGFKYLHRPNDYLDFFALGYNEPKKTFFNTLFKRKIKINETSWNGLNLNKANKIFKPFQDKSNQLIILEKATRIHPFQTIEWYNKGLIAKNIFAEITKETTHKFEQKHKNYKCYFKNDNINIVMHVDRGKNYNKKVFPLHFEHHENVRYMFPLSYYENIYNQISNLFAGRKHKIHIYSEKANSEPIVNLFKDKKNTVLHIGNNRNKQHYEFVYDIFYHFAMSDIFIGSNSSFSAVVAHYRHNKPMIYHPHQHLRHLPTPNYIPTDENGSFDTEILQSFINE